MKFFIAMALVAGLVIWFVSRIGRGRPSIMSLRGRLQKLTHDPLVAERLVASEMKRHPEMDEAAVLRRVILRLERDRR